MDQKVQKELRIGNWLMDDQRGCEIEVSPELIYRFSQEVGSVENYSKIPITEERLVKFGFEKDESLIDPPDTPNGNFWADWVKNDIIISLPYFEFHYNELQASIEIKYVHQLQNLYFALTSKELDIK